MIKKICLVLTIFLFVNLSANRADAQRTTLSASSNINKAGAKVYEAYTYMSPTYQELFDKINSKNSIVISEDNYPQKIQDQIEQFKNNNKTIGQIIKMVKCLDGTFLVHFYFADTRYVISHELDTLGIFKADTNQNIFYFCTDTEDIYARECEWYDKSGNMNIIKQHGVLGPEVRWWHIYKYDKNGNKIKEYSVKKDGTESWYDYDENGNRHYINSDGSEWWSDYDLNRNEIHYRNSNGSEYWYDYDKNGNVISYRWTTTDKRSFRGTRTYDNVKVLKNNTNTRQTYSKTINDYDKSALEIWYTYSTDYNDTDKWEERNFVIQIRFKADGSWSSTINGKRVENISGEGTLRFEMLPNGKMKATPNSGDWWLVD